MLTPEQIAALGDAAADVAVPMEEYLLRDIARRVAGAGQLTSTAAYQIYRAQQLGMSRKQIERELRRLLGVSHKELRDLLRQSAEVGYDFDISRLPREAVPFAENIAMQQMVTAAVNLAKKDFTNLTQTLGMVAPDGKAYPLKKAYQQTMDYAFQQVFTGATDYNTAIRNACRNIADQGVRVIDYESGVHTGLEAAVRRNVMGGMGLMQERISQSNHDQLGADGWEISAHAASAPDHEPIQGRQYSDAAYAKLNGSLKRRIGTLNCGHAAFPIILGVNEAQYSPEQLAEFQRQNVQGVDYQGRHYSWYEATQKQRQVERAIRKQKNRVLVSEATGDKEALQISQIRLGRLNEEYARFSKAVGLPTRRERAFVAGFGRGQATRASAYKKPLQSQRDDGILKPVSTAPMNTGRVLQYDQNADFSIKLDGYSDTANQGLSQASKRVAMMGGKDGREYLSLVDLDSGKEVYFERGDAMSVGGTKFWEAVNSNQSSRLSFVHNHNTDGCFSETDLRTLLTTNRIQSFVAVRIDGVKYIVEKIGVPPKGVRVDKLYETELSAINEKSRQGVITSGERSHMREELIVANLIRDYTKGLIVLDGRKKG